MYWEALEKRTRRDRYEKGETREKDRAKERVGNGAENLVESAEHRMAEGVVGWIQLLGEQYCLAVIVCSSTCSGFPDLGP